MSVWAKLGLADMNTLLQMKEEIKCLKEENQRLIDEKSGRLFDCLVEQSNKYIETSKKDVIMLTSQLEMLQKSLDSGMSGIESLREQNAELLKDIDDFICEFKKNNSQIEQNIKNTVDAAVIKIREQIEKVTKQIESLMIAINGISSESKKMNFVNDERFEQLLSTFNEYKSDSVSSEEFKKEISVVNESIISLWKILKVLFVDSAINELEKSI